MAIRLLISGEKDTLQSDRLTPAEREAAKVRKFKRELEQGI